MDKETFEAQAEAVRRILEANRHKLTQIEAKHLACAARNLEQLAEVRRLVVAQIQDEAAPTDVSEGLAEQLIKLLHLPSTA